MRERLAKEARYQRRDAPGYSFEFKQMQKAWMQPKTRRGAPDLERVSLPYLEMRCDAKPARWARPRNLDEAVGHAFDTVALIWSVARKNGNDHSEKTIAPRVTESVQATAQSQHALVVRGRQETLARELAI